MKATIFVPREIEFEGEFCGGECKSAIYHYGWQCRAFGKDLRNTTIAGTENGCNLIRTPQCIAATEAKAKKGEERHEMP